jgi:hypothetical protein
MAVAGRAAISSDLLNLRILLTPVVFLSRDAV